MRKGIIIIFALIWMISLVGCTNDKKEKEDDTDKNVVETREPEDKELPLNDDDESEEENVNESKQPETDSQDEKTKEQQENVIVLKQGNIYEDYYVFKNLYPSEMEQMLKPGETYLYHGEMGPNYIKPYLTIVNRSDKEMPLYLCDVISLEQKICISVLNSCWGEFYMMMPGDTTAIDEETPWHDYDVMKNLEDGTVALGYQITNDSYIYLNFDPVIPKEDKELYIFKGYKIESESEIGPALKTLTEADGHTEIYWTFEDPIYPLQ